jgi:hypothetical protein
MIEVGEVEVDQQLGTRLRLIEASGKGVSSSIG